MRASHVRTAAIAVAIVACALVGAFAHHVRSTRADIVPGQYSMELSVGETAVAVGGQFTAFVGVYHNGAPYQGVQWDVDYAQNVLDAGLMSVESAAVDVCDIVSDDDNGSRVLLACADTSGPDISYSGAVFRVRFTCIADGSGSLTLTGSTYVDGGPTNPPVHLHHDSVACGSGSSAPTSTPAPAPPPTPAPGQESCTVAEVITGDSFLCTNGKRVRMLQVDAQDPGQCGGGWARAALAYIFLPPGRTVTLDFDDDRSEGGYTLAAPIARGTDGHDYNLSVVMVYVGLAKAAVVGDGNTKYLDWANASELWASVAQWNMWAPEKTYTGGCD